MVCVSLSYSNFVLSELACTCAIMVAGVLHRTLPPPGECSTVLFIGLWPQSSENSVPVQHLSGIYMYMRVLLVLANPIRNYMYFLIQSYYRSEEHETIGSLFLP